MNTAKKFIVSAGIVAVSAGLLAGCTRAGDGVAATSTRAADDPIDIGVVVTGISLYPYFQAEVDGIEAAAAEMGEDVTITVLDSQANDETEQSNMQQVINAGVDVIIYTPGSDAVGASQAAAAAAAGIPIVAVDRDVEGADAYIGYDNVALGEAMASYAVDQLGGTGSIGGEIGVPGVINVIKRSEGWTNVFAENPGIDYVGEVTTNFDPTTAYTVTQNLLTGNPETQWILVMDDNTALGAVRAVADVGSSARVVGLGGQTAGLESIADGGLAATVVMKPYELGQVGLETAVKIVRGEDFDARPSFDLQVATKDNAASFIGQEGVGW